MSFMKTLWDFALMRRKPLREQEEVPYSSFQKRLIATVVDMIVMAPVLYLAGRAAALGVDKEALLAASQSGDPAVFIFLLKQWGLQLAVLTPIVLLLWNKQGATPGKMLLRMKIVDAKTGGQPTMKQWIVRYVGYLVVTLLLMLGFFWILIDKKRQGWHDKMAGTVVVNLPKQPKAKQSA